MPLHYQHVIPYFLPRYKRRYEAKFDLNRGAHFNLMVVIHNEHSERWFTDKKLKIEFGKLEKFERVKQVDVQTQFHSHICIYNGIAIFVFTMVPIQSIISSKYQYKSIMYESY